MGDVCSGNTCYVVFLYGSLLNPSELKSVGIDPALCSLAAVRGYRRVFGKDSSRRCAALTLAEGLEDELVWGIVCPVDKAAFDKLKIREKGYITVDVNVVVYSQFGNVRRSAIAFIAGAGSLLDADSYLDRCADDIGGFRKLLAYLKILTSLGDPYYNVPFDLLSCELARSYTPSGEPILCTLIYTLSKLYEETIVEGLVEEDYLTPVETFGSYVKRGAGEGGGCGEPPGEVVGEVKDRYLKGWGAVPNANKIDNETLAEALRLLCSKCGGLRRSVERGSLDEVLRVLERLLDMRNIGVTTATYLLHLALPEHLPPFSEPVRRLLFGKRASQALGSKDYGRLGEMYSVYVRLTHYLTATCRYSLEKLREKLPEREKGKSLVKLVDQALWLAQRLVEDAEKRSKAGLSEEAKTIHSLVKRLIACTIA